DFWQDQKKATATTQEEADLRYEVATWEELLKEVTDTLEIARMDEDDQDVSMREMVEQKYEELAKRYQQLEFYLLFGGVHDKRNAVVSLHAGTGGVDAMDWN